MTVSRSKLVIWKSVANKRIFKLISLCKDEWEFVGRSKSISNNEVTEVSNTSSCQCYEQVVEKVWHSLWRRSWRLGSPRTVQASLYVLLWRIIWQACRWIESRCFDCCPVILVCQTGHAYYYGSYNSFITVDQIKHAGSEYSRECKWGLNQFTHIKKKILP